MTPRKSIDGGRRFESLVRVSEDKWERNGCPEDGPTLAVDQAGTIDIAWSTVVDEGEPPEGTVLCGVAGREDVLSACASAR